VFSSRGFRSAAFIVFSVYLAASVVAPIFPLFVEQLAASKVRVASKTGVIIGVGGIAAALAAVILGRLSDRAGHKRIIVGCVLASGLICIPHALAQNLWQLFGLRMLFALAAAGTVPTANAAVSAIIPRYSHGKAFGLTASLSCVARVVGPLVGALTASLFGLRVPFVVMGLLLIGAGLAYALRAKEPSLDFQREGTQEH